MTSLALAFLGCNVRISPVEGTVLHWLNTVFDNVTSWLQQFALHICLSLFYDRLNGLSSFKKRNSVDF